jgi:hypothetical protein
MGDKSRPHHNAKKEPKKSLKEKRAEKHAKSESKTPHVEIIPHGKK